MKFENKFANALSRRVTLLFVMSAKVAVWFERLREEYESCLDFGEIFIALREAPCLITDDYSLKDGYLFKINKLCIPCTSVRDFLVWELHSSGLVGHFRGVIRPLKRWSENFIDQDLSGMLPR